MKTAKEIIIDEIQFLNDLYKTKRNGFNWKNKIKYQLLDLVDLINTSEDDLK